MGVMGVMRMMRIGVMDNALLLWRRCPKLVAKQSYSKTICSSKPNRIYTGCLSHKLTDIIAMLAIYW